MFYLDGPFSAHGYAGLAPGWVALDQVNVKVPENAREGYAVPLLISTGDSASTKPVTVSIHRGGGQCVDPPMAGYAKVEWKRTIIAGAGPDIKLDGVTVSLQASPGSGCRVRRCRRGLARPLCSDRILGQHALCPLTEAWTLGRLRCRVLVSDSRKLPSVSSARRKAIRS